MLSVARSEGEPDPALYVGLGLFQTLRELNQEISEIHPSDFDALRSRRQVRTELHQIISRHFGNVTFSEAIGNYADYVAQWSREPIISAVGQLPYALKEGIKWHLRPEFHGSLGDAPPDLFHHALGRVLGRIVRYNYLRIIREGWAQGIFDLRDFTIDQEIYDRDWEDMETRARVGNYSLELTAESFYRTALLEKLVREVREEWGNVHPLWEGFQGEAFRGMSGFASMEDFWQHLQTGARLLERVLNLQQAPGNLSRGDEIFPGDTTPSLPPLMDPGFSIISMMPRTIKNAVFGDLEMMDHQFVAAPSYAVARQLARAVWADNQVQLPEPFSSRGVDIQDLHRSAQWIRIRMADLHGAHRAYYDRLLNYYFNMVSEASWEGIQLEIRRLPRELSSEYIWEELALDTELPAVKDLYLRGSCLGGCL